VTPPFLGTRVVADIPVGAILSHLDTRTLFTFGWGLTGPDAASLATEVGQPRLEYWLNKLKTKPIIDPKVVYGYFPVKVAGSKVIVTNCVRLDSHSLPLVLTGCNRLGNHSRASDPLGSIACAIPHSGPQNEVEFHSAAQSRPVILRGARELSENLGESVTFDFPRQAREPYRCLADWISEILPIQLVTIGQSASDYAAELFAADKYRDYYEFNALAGMLTEALADYWHNQIRTELGIPQNQGMRFSLGYPACPNLADRRKIVRLLNPERIGVTLSDEYQLHPEFSTDAFIITDPRATYFSASQSAAQQ
jgi:5-methyltetrahydrofolate--homocysteine methyltransferase